MCCTTKLGSHFNSPFSDSAPLASELQCSHRLMSVSINETLKMIQYFLAAMLTALGAGQDVRNLNYAETKMSFRCKRKRSLLGPHHQLVIYTTISKRYNIMLFRYQGDELLVSPLVLGIQLRSFRRAQNVSYSCSPHLSEELISTARNEELSNTILRLTSFPVLYLTIPATVIIRDWKPAKIFIYFKCNLWELRSKVRALHGLEGCRK